ncbi:reverse transcriptase domain-containing protein [Tanacetum coccineum]
MKLTSWSCQAANTCDRRQSSRAFCRAAMPPVERYFGFSDSDSDESGVTHTEISSPFEGLSDIGSPGVVGPEHEGLPWMLDDPYVQVALQAPPSPDYIPGPEEPQSPPLPDFVPEPVYPEYMPQEDEVFPAEEQPLPAAASPTAQSPDYVPESDPEADPEEDDDEDPEEDPVDYPADGGDDGDDEDESSEDDDVDIEADDDEEEEEHPAPADSTTVALPAADQAPSAEETEPFETDESAATPPPHPAYRVTARISIPAPVPTPVWSDAEVARLLAISTPPSSPLSPWSSPLPQIPSPPLPPILSPLPVSPPLPQIPSPPLPVSSPVPVLSPSPPASPIRPLGYRAAMIRLRAEAASTSHSLPLPPPIILSHTRPDAPSSGIPPLHLLSTDHRADRPEVTLPPRKRLGIALGPRHEVGESSSADPAARQTRGLRTDYGFVATMDREIMRDLDRNVGYGITDTWDEMLVDMPRAPATDDTEMGRRMTEFTTRVRQDTDEIYTRLDDEQSERQLMAGRLNMLYRDRRAHARTARIMEAKARIGYVVTYSGGSTAGSDYIATNSRPREIGGDYRDAGGRPQETGAVHRGTKAAEETSDSDDKKMAPKRATRSNIAPEITNTTYVTNAQIQAMINQGVIAALTARDANRIENQVKFANCTLHSVALTWWNTHVKTLGHDAAYGIGFVVWEDVSRRIIKKYVGGLPDMIHGSVVASKPKIMQDAVEIATELTDKKIRTFYERQTKSKREFEDTSRNTQNQQQQQQQNKRQNTGQAYTAGSGEKKPYGGSKSLCAKCNYHHYGPCTPKCHKCNKVGHFARDCRSTANANNANNQKGTVGSEAYLL